MALNRRHYASQSHFSDPQFFIEKRERLRSRPGQLPNRRLGEKEERERAVEEDEEDANVHLLARRREFCIQVG